MTDQKLSNNIFPLTRIRRNHALEHATLHMLARKNKKLQLGGYSDMRGFWIVGDVSTEELQQAVDEGLKRLQNGERQYAVHPNCGTNFAIMGLAAGAMAWLGMLNSGSSLRHKIERLPLIVSLVTFSLILTQPLGPVFQAQFTTDPDPGNMYIYAITQFVRKGIPMHRVVTRT